MQKLPAAAPVMSQIRQSFKSTCDAAISAGQPGHPGARLLAAIYSHALATGFARGFMVAAAIMLLALIITIATIRVRPAVPASIA